MMNGILNEVKLLIMPEKLSTEYINLYNFTSSKEKSLLISSVFLGSRKSFKESYKVHKKIGQM